MPGADVLGGILASAAGAGAGGYVGGLLMGDTSYPKGGGIEGLTSADTGKSGVYPAVQIDPSKALEYFAKASDAFRDNSMTGMGIYSQSMQQAFGQLTSGYNQANTTLTQLSAAGTTATNEYMHMLGLNTLSPTVGYDNSVYDLGKNYQNLSKIMTQTENVKGYNSRLGMLDTINAQFAAANKQESADNAANLKAALAGLGARPSAKEIMMRPQYGDLFHDFAWNYGFTDTFPGHVIQEFQPYPHGGGGMDAKSQEGMRMASFMKEKLIKDANLPDSVYEDYLRRYAGAQFGGMTPDMIAKNGGQGFSGKFSNDPLRGGEAYQAIAEYDKKVAALQNQYSDANDPELKKAAELQKMYERNFDEQGSYFGYTAEEVQDKLEATPGYQFQLNQGLDKIKAAAAAGGMLGSGNLLTSVNDYSQQYAANAYQGYLSNLNVAMGYGNAATGQISANQANLGTGLASLSQAAGSTLLGAYQNIGQAAYNSLMHSGDVWNQDMLANMQAQNNSIARKQNNDMQAALGNQQAGIQGGYLQLQQANMLNNFANQTGSAQSFMRGVTLG